MPKLLTRDAVARYHRDGFHFPVRVMSADRARHYRDSLEAYERARGGAMKFWPGSHRRQQFEHRDTSHQHNLLSRGQELAVDVPESEGVPVPIDAGEISLHHVKLVHGSESSRTANRRIGFAIRDIPPHVRQLKTRDSAMLVRGVDDHRNFDPEPEPVSDSDDAALAAHAGAVQRQVAAPCAGTYRAVFRT